MFVMLDLDGTLVDTSSLYLTGVPLIVQRYLGCQIDVDDYMDLWGHDVRAWFTRARLRSFGAAARQASGNSVESDVDAMYADFEAFYITNHHCCPVYPDVAEGLACLKDLGHRVGIVTTRPQRRAELVYDFRWSSTLDFVVGGDRVARRKPFPDSLDYAIDAYGAREAGQAHVYVGDNAIDIQAAHASRYPILGVAAMWGARDSDALVAANPDIQFGRFLECAHWMIGAFSTAAEPGAARKARAVNA